MSAKPKKASKRDFTAEAATELDAIVSAYPNRQATELFDIAVKHCPSVRWFLDESAEAARHAQFRTLLRFSKVRRDDGTTVRLNLCYKKWVQSENGKEKQVRLWKRLESMTWDEAQDALRDLDEHIIGSVESRNAIADYWNELHPGGPQLRRRETYR